VNAVVVGQKRVVVILNQSQIGQQHFRLYVQLRHETGLLLRIVAAHARRISYSSELRVIVVLTVRCVIPPTASASEMTYIVSSGALNSTHSPRPLRKIRTFLSCTTSAT